MAVFKCKMCGGTLQPEEGSTVCECEYCGSKQTIPNLDDDKKIKLFDRANRLRFNNEFDKAASVYESIVADFPEEAEAYWGLVLCTYGIEYVDDPATGDKVPTCHRSSFDSVMDDENFELVMEYADCISRSVYREEAKKIEEIRKGIIEVSGKEAPYDIFICYKETDDNGERTIDSVIAQDVYDALTAKDYRVFFSRISLEDKLGTEYEPYIFAALNSAKVMLAFGTSYDYYNAVWVKNEWSRYLKLMAKDRSRHLIPCFKNIDAYDIPKEFAKLQAQDMGKVGAVQDLLRGIDKILGRTESSQQPVQQTVVSGQNALKLIIRGNMSLEDGQFEEAKNFFNQALNDDPRSSEAYLGLFLAELHAMNRNAAKNIFVETDYRNNRYWIRAKQFASGQLLEELEGWAKEQESRIKQKEEVANQKRQEEEEKKRQKEEAKAGLRDEIAHLEEQLKGGYEYTAEEQAELGRLKETAQAAETAYIDAKNAFQSNPERVKLLQMKDQINTNLSQINNLGAFKVKEKRALIQQNEELKYRITVIQKTVNEYESKIENLRKSSVIADRNLDGFYLKKRDAIYVRILFCRQKLEHMKGVYFYDTKNGETIRFGRYQQGHGTDSIEWMVLFREEHYLLLVSKYVLDILPYHSHNTRITWERCSLRNWLNTTFFNKAFNPDEQARIKDTRLLAEKSPVSKFPVGNDTTDKVFLLSTKDVEKYFKTDNDRKCKPTDYAKNLSNIVSAQDTTSCGWWLRSPGFDSDSAAKILINGSIDFGGGSVDMKSIGVRPAMIVEC